MHLQPLPALNKQNPHDPQQILGVNHEPSTCSCLSLAIHGTAPSTPPASAPAPPCSSATSTTSQARNSSSSCPLHVASWARWAACRGGIRRCSCGGSGWHVAGLAPSSVVYLAPLPPPPPPLQLLRLLLPPAGEVPPGVLTALAGRVRDVSLGDADGGSCGGLAAEGAAVVADAAADAAAASSLAEACVAIHRYEVLCHTKRGSRV